MDGVMGENPEGGIVHIRSEMNQDIARHDPFPPGSPRWGSIQYTSEMGKRMNSFEIIFFMIHLKWAVL
jgi:hypothetical protein